MRRQPKRASAGGRTKKAAVRGGAGTPAASSGSVREWFKSILVAAVLFVFLRTFVVQTVVVISGSMKPILLVGDMVVVNRAVYGSEVPFVGVRVPGYSEPRRGDIVVFQPPPLDSTADGKVVKRVVGVPGDTLRMLDRVLFIDGRPEAEPYATHGEAPDEASPWMEWQKTYLASTVAPEAYAPTRDNWGPLVIPEGHYFMMGDNREESLDSRYWGLVERNDIEGRPVFLYFSYDRESYRAFPWVREIRWGRIGTTLPRQMG